MSGIKLAAQYSFKPHQLGFCGPQKKQSKKALAAKQNLKKFKTAYAYYKLIAKCNNIKNIFDQKVIRAYWTGNKLLERVPVSEFRKLIKQKFKLNKNIPDNALPHHNTHVELIGAVYSNLKFTKKIKKLCKITCKNSFSYHWGLRCEKLSKKNLENLRKYG